MTTSQLFNYASMYFILAFIIGLFLYFQCGIGVFYYALIGGVLAVLYPFMSRICLSEVSIGLIYGPILFGGVYYVMCGSYQLDVFLPCADKSSIDLYQAATDIVIKTGNFKRNILLKPSKELYHCKIDANNNVLLATRRFNDFNSIIL